MVISACQHQATRKSGKDHLGNQRYVCLICGKRFIDRSNRLFGDLRIDHAKAVMVLRMMLEGCSIRTIERITTVNRNTIMAILLLIGERCQRFLKDRIRGIHTGDVQVDELWAFIGCKEKYRQAMRRSESLGDSYTFLAIDRTSKLILTHQIGKRDSGNTRIFASKLREAIYGDCHITSDGFAPYTQAMPVTLWDKDITFAQLIKVFGSQTQRVCPIVNLCR